MFCTAYFFQLSYYELNLKYSRLPKFLFSSLWQLERGKYNVPIATENLKKKRLSHNVFWAKFGESREKYHLHLLKTACSYYTYVHDAVLCFYSSDILTHSPAV